MDEDRLAEVALELAVVRPICMCCNAKPVRCRSLCNACYERHRRHGTLQRPVNASPRTPHVDHIAVERACHGDDVALTVAERGHAIHHLTAAGLSARAIGARLRVAARTVQRYRAGQVIHARDVA